MFPLLRCSLMPSPSLFFVACAVEFQVGVLAPEDFSVCQIFPCEDWQFGVLVLAVLFVWEMVWDSPIVNIVLQTMKRQLLVNTLVNWWEFEIFLPGDLKLLYDVMRTASLQLARPLRGSRTERALRARPDYKLTSLGASRGDILNLRWLDPDFFGGYHPSLKLSGIPTFTFIVSLTHRMDNI